MLNNPDALIEALQAYKAERMQRLALEAENFLSTAGGLWMGRELCIMGK